MSPSPSRRAAPTGLHREVHYLSQSPIHSSFCANRRAIDALLTRYSSQIDALPAFYATVTRLVAYVFRM
jgi:hypothetical protein